MSAYELIIVYGTMNYISFLELHHFEWQLSKIPILNLKTNILLLIFAVQSIEYIVINLEP
jgi:hypothetical protein